MKAFMICPYSEQELLKACEVESCCFNLADKPISQVYRRCFLQYKKVVTNNVYKIDALDQAEYHNLPKKMREQIVSLLLDLNDDSIAQAKSNFYFSLFAILSQDTVINLPKKQHAPVIYRQCCVCGQASDTLYFPKSRTLPDGWGYCSWSCYQALPPPLLALERILEVNVGDMMKNLRFQGFKNRVSYIKNLTTWVIGSNSF